MSVVRLTINRRDYPIDCEDGQEDRVRSLGRLIDERVGELVEAEGQAGDTQLLVMASLLFADEASVAKEAQDEARDAREALKEAQDKVVALNAANSAAKLAEDEAAGVIENMAAMIESLADAIEKD